METSDELVGFRSTIEEHNRRDTIDEAQQFFVADTGPNLKKPMTTRSKEYETAITTAKKVFADAVTIATEANQGDASVATALEQANKEKRKAHMAGLREKAAQRARKNESMRDITYSVGSPSGTVPAVAPGTPASEGNPPSEVGVTGNAEEEVAKSDED